MSTSKIRVYKGTLGEYFDIDTEESLQSLRNALIEKEYISRDIDNKFAWRFFKFDAKKTFPTTDAIIALEIEEDLSVKSLLKKSEHLYLTNTLNDNKPDLMGILTQSYTDRQIDCRIFMNENNESAKLANKNKFKPLMLKHVMSTNKQISADFDNVFICEKGTAISFDITVVGHNGFAHSIKPDKGGYIVNRLYNMVKSLYTNGDGESVTSTTGRYEDSEKNIVVDSTEVLDIPTTEAINYQRITVKAWRLDSYVKNNQLRVVSHSKSSFRKKRNAQITIIPGEGIKTATVLPDGYSDDKFVSIMDVKEDTSDILGQVIIHFFIFKSHDHASKVFGINNLSDKNYY